MPIMGIPPVCCPPIIGIALGAPGPIGIPCDGWVGVPFAAGGGVLVCASTPVADPARIAAIKRAFREDIAHSPSDLSDSHRRPSCCSVSQINTVIGYFGFRAR